MKVFIRSEGCLRVASIKPFYKDVKPLTSAHNSSCTICSARCKCQGASYEGPTLSFEVNLERDESVAPPITRAVSTTGKDDVNYALTELCKQISRHSCLEAHGFSQELVTDLIFNVTEFSQSIIF